jgi:hypothetical protein
MYITNTMPRIGNYHVKTTVQSQRSRGGGDQAPNRVTSLRLSPAYLSFDYSTTASSLFLNIVTEWELTT